MGRVEFMRLHPCTLFAMFKENRKIKLDNMKALACLIRGGSIEDEDVPPDYDPAGEGAMF
ncbi:MAG: hypothetical protein PHX80_04225 [Candidatus Nanoarchaeia archaeon]|nr:hypothetical protein [Candidatus Nanoarchaeia archaeon]